MKKFISLLCILTCILGLTACGSEKQYSVYQLQKLEAAESRIYQDYIPILMMFMEDEMLDNFSQYTPEELEAIFLQNGGINIDGNGFLSAAKSFHNNGKTTGAITIKTDAKPELTVDGKKIVAHVQVAGEKKDAEVELILSNDSFLKLESGALNPVSGKGELMLKAALNTLIGMTTVFTVLILISLIIGCFGFIPKIQESLAGNKKKEEVSGIDKAVAQIARQEEILEEDMDGADDLELAAVIAAAVAAYEGSSGANGYVVRSIRKINR